MQTLVILLTSVTAALGLWVVLFCSPVVRHIAWFFWRSGRRSGNPAWTLIDFSDQLMLRAARGTWWAAPLDKLMTCRACQSIHGAAVAAVLAAVRGADLAPENWAIALLTIIASFYWLTGLLAKN